MKGINKRYLEYEGFDYRLIWIKEHGEIPKEHFIHHINGDKTDNRIENLECVDRIKHGERHRELNRKKKELSCERNNYNYNYNYSLLERGFNLGILSAKDYWRGVLIIFEEKKNLSI